MTLRAPVAPAPPQRDSRSEYERRIHRVMAHIESHLDQPLDLETLAAVASFSAFHFHRLFRAWTGETLGEHLRRRRVETGAMRLLTQPRSTVLEVALAVGFGSGEAFARAFKLRLGVAPSAWRQQRKTDQAKRSRDQAAEGAGFDHGFPATHPIEDSGQPMRTALPGGRYACMRFEGTVEEIDPAWHRLLGGWLPGSGLQLEARPFLEHDPAGSAFDPETGVFDCSICVPVTAL